MSGFLLAWNIRICTWAVAHAEVPGWAREVFDGTVKSPQAETITVTYPRANHIGVVRIEDYLCRASEEFRRLYPGDWSRRPGADGPSRAAGRRADMWSPRYRHRVPVR